MKKYIIEAVCISILLICSTFVSSTGNKTDDKYNYNSNFEYVKNENGLLSCDHIGYILGSGQDCFVYEFILNNPNNLTCICEGGGWGDFMSGAAFSDDDYIYCCQYNNGILWGLDLNTCEMWVIGGGGTGLNGLTYDDLEEFLYGCSSTALYKIDPETGEQDYIGAFQISTSMIGIACDAYGSLYGWDVKFDEDSYLYEIDKDTGEATLICSLGMSLMYNSDGEFCKIDDILYIVVTGPPPNYRCQLYECDIETGDCSHIGQFPEDVEITALAIPYNNPPYTPYNPIPPDGAENWTGGGLCWSGGDPDGDEVVYDVYFGNYSPPPMIESNYSGNCTDIFYNWEPNTTYYWKIVAWDEHGASTEGPIWSFTLDRNYPPDPAHNPFPPDGYECVPVDAVLYWNGSDPNQWDTLTYDVYFGPNPDPPIAALDLSKNEYDPYDSNPMELYQEYFWSITTRDKSGLQTPGPEWTFTTGCYCTPPTIDGPTHGKAKVKYNYTFTSTDELVYIFFVDWGDDSPIETLYPTSYDGQQAVANHSWNKEGTYSICAQTENIFGGLSEWGCLEVIIPRTKTTKYLLLKWFLERFPLLEVFLRIMKI